MSKGFAMTGWRIGYIATNKILAAACDKLQGQFTSGTNSIAQYASIAALKGPLDDSFNMRDAYKRRRELAMQALHNIKGIKMSIPEGAFYAFPDISYFFGKSYNGQTIHTATDLSMYLMNTVYVATVTGEAFGAPDCIRISFATNDEKLVIALERIRVALEKLI